jgi:hypothetical protein
MNKTSTERCSPECEWGYAVDSKGVLLKFETRHDAVGFAAIWPHKCDIYAVKNPEKELLTLEKEQANTDTDGGQADG